MSGDDLLAWERPAVAPPADALAGWNKILEGWTRNENKIAFMQIAMEFWRKWLALFFAMNGRSTTAVFCNGMAWHGMRSILYCSEVASLSAALEA